MWKRPLFNISPQQAMHNFSPLQSEQLSMSSPLLCCMSNSLYDDTTPAAFQLYLADSALSVGSLVREHETPEKCPTAEKALPNCPQNHILLGPLNPEQ